MSPVSATLPEEKTPASTRVDKSAPLGREARDDRDESHEPAVTVIEADRSWWPIVDFQELWLHRDMLYSLTMREIMRRYKQTVLGVVWAILPVLGNTALVGFFFGPLVKDRVDGYPVSLFIFTGLLPWYLFSNIMNGVANSVISHPDLINKVYFPRLILPLSGVGDRLVDFLIGMIILGIALPFYAGGPGVHWLSPNAIFVLPIVIVGLVAGGLGVGLLFAAVGVAYRDVFHALALLTQFWMFATPSIFFAKTIIPETVQPWLPLNPAFGLIENFRAVMTGRDEDYPALFISLGVSFALLLIGLIYFRKAERNFSDVI